MWEDVYIIPDNQPFWARQIKIPDGYIVLHARRNYIGTLVITQSLRLHDYVVREDIIEIPVDLLQELLDKESAHASDAHS